MLAAAMLQYSTFGGSRFLSRAVLCLLKWQVLLDFGTMRIDGRSTWVFELVVRISRKRNLFMTGYKPKDGNGTGAGDH